jgi:hypothetical protein
MAYLHFGLEDRATGDHPRYWQALGRFIDAFSKLEAQIFVLLMNKGHVPQNTARAVFSGTRAELALSYLKRIQEGLERDVPAYVERAITQFNAINSARNDIVHYGASEDGAFIVSNALKTIPSRAKEASYGPEIIDAMRADLETISAAFYVWLIDDGHAQGWSKQGRNWAEVALDPWQYKPPQPANIRQKKRGR